MKIIFSFSCLILISFNLSGQDCTIVSKANNIIPDKFCSPVNVEWEVIYRGVNNGGTPVQIRYDWDDGSSSTATASNTGAGIFQVTANHTYVSTDDKCNYHPKATLIVNGVLCSSSVQEQIVTVWDDDDHNGGHMHISPAVYPICFGNNANVQFQDLTQFNCVPPQEEDVPNQYSRWVQWIYGTDLTMTGLPITINGTGSTYPFSGPIINLPGPVTGSGIYSDIINVANDKLVGEYFQVTLRNWNYCNPYDDPNILGPPADPVNGDNDPVTTTAIILIVPYPDATIAPVDTLCVQSDPVTLTAHDPGGTWSGDGVTGNKFYPASAGAGDHIVRYDINDTNGCSDTDQISIAVLPSPSVSINPAGTHFVNDPPVVLTALPSGGTFTGDGITADTFNPASAGLGTHIITYQTLPDKYGCSGIDTIHINVIMPPLPIAYFEPDTVGCSPLFLQFRNTSQLGESYLWDFGDKIYSTEKNPSHTYYIADDYIVRLTVSNITGQTTYVRLISVRQNPTAIFTLYPTDVINNAQVVMFQNHSYYAVSYLWDFGDGNTSSEENPWHKYESDGIYYITLTVTSADECVDSTIYKSPVNVSYLQGEIKFPNAFRWNRTGPTGGYWDENQFYDVVFHPDFKNVIEYKLQIFNRWGVLIYESNDLKKGWDGYFGNGHLALQGVYVWKATGRYANGTYFNKVGDVTFLH